MTAAENQAFFARDCKSEGGIIISLVISDPDSSEFWQMTFKGASNSQTLILDSQ